MTSSNPNVQTPVKTVGDGHSVCAACVPDMMMTPAEQALTDHQRNGEMAAMGLNAGENSGGY